MSRKKMTSDKFPRHHDVVDTIDIGCSDRRIRGSRGILGRFMGCTMATPITIPGAAKDLVTPKYPRDREFLLEKIELVIKGVKKIRVRMHTECKGCNERTDLDYYENVLIEAGRVLKERFPWIEVILVIVDFEGLYLVREDQVPAETVMA